MLILVPYNLVFVSIPPIRAVKEATLHKPHHFIFIKVYFTKIAFPIFVIGIVRTGFTTGFGFFHINHLSFYLKSIAKKGKKVNRRAVCGVYFLEDKWVLY